MLDVLVLEQLVVAASRNALNETTRFKALRANKVICGFFEKYQS